MDLKECYTRFGGDFDEVLGRLRREALVQKFVFKFLDDKSFQLFNESMVSKNYEEAFRAAHTIKGICQNLSFTKLYSSCNKLTEALREQNIQQAEELIPQFLQDYTVTFNSISEYKASIGGQV